MKFYRKIIVLSFLLLLFNDKAIAQNTDKSSQQRVIFEQNMSYDDVRQMKTIVERMEKQKMTEKQSNEQVNPIINAINNDSDHSSSMVDMLRTLLKAMGMNASQVNIDEQQGSGGDAKSDQKGKAWGGSYNWKGIRSEQR